MRKILVSTNAPGKPSTAIRSEVVRGLKCSQDALSDADVREAVHLVRTILPHVSDCDGLSIMTERLPQVQAVLDTRDRSRQGNVDLLE
jgi:hypothetical protein